MKKVFFLITFLSFSATTPVLRANGDSSLTEVQRILLIASIPLVVLGIDKTSEVIKNTTGDVIKNLLQESGSEGLDKFFSEEPLLELLDRGMNFGNIFDPQDE